MALIHQILQMWRQFKFSGRPDHWKPKSHFKISINMAIRVMKHAQVKTFFWNFAHFLHFLEIWNFSGTNQKSFSFLREVWLIFNLWYPWLEFRWKYGAVAWNQIFGKNIYPCLCAKYMRKCGTLLLQSFNKKLCSTECFHHYSTSTSTIQEHLLVPCTA